MHLKYISSTRIFSSRFTKIFLLFCACAFIGSSRVKIVSHNTARQTAASAQSSNWGLSFQEEGKRPVGNATIEGPKFYKRDGWYYIFAPAGGVPTGWQTVLRSKNIWGPYEWKIVMAQGNTNINGPHQGAWVDTPDGKEDWFFHFQDKEAYGRVVHLQPM